MPTNADFAALSELVYTTNFTSRGGRALKIYSRTAFQ